MAYFDNLDNFGHFASPDLIAVENNVLSQPSVAALNIVNMGYYEEKAPLQRTSTRYEVTDCLFAGMTDSAETVVIENPDYGRMLFLDRELQSTSYDEKIYHETLVHPVMRATAHIADKRVLVVGGAEGATVREVLRWAPNRVSRIDWVDIDPTLVDVCRMHLRYAPTVYNNTYANYHASDIMQFLQNSTEKYDVIILDLPDPDPSESVLYGVEFWDLIRNALTPGGAVVSHAGPIEPRRHQGLDIVRSGAVLGAGAAYHTLIPSFQGEWAFWMSCAPSTTGFLPNGCEIMNNEYQNTIFHWDAHWF
jgi:spermidine synthase